MGHVHLSAAGNPESMTDTAVSEGLAYLMQEGISTVSCCDSRPWIFNLRGSKSKAHNELLKCFHEASVQVMLG